MLLVDSSTYLTFRWAIVGIDEHHALNFLSFHLLFWLNNILILYSTQTLGVNEEEKMYFDDCFESLYLFSCCLGTLLLV